MTPPLPVWPQFAPGAAKAVAAILKSGRTNYWGGEYGVRFEEEFSRWAHGRQAVAVSSGTAALHLALEALGLGKGDDVVCTPYSFRASATAAANAGARAVFADVGDDHMLTAETIEKALTPKTKAVVVVHLYGQVADMGPILALARRRGFKVVEDCAQALGAEYRGRKVGTLGDAGCFSFCQLKHITAGGEGGMVVCKSKKAADAVRSLRDHGWEVGTSPKRYSRIGYNFRLTEIQSALALGELKRLDSWNLPRRRRLAERLLAALSGHPAIAQLPVDTPERRASFWLVPVVLDTRRLGVDAPSFAQALQAEGAGAYAMLWPPMARRKNALRLMRSTVGFWVHPTYGTREIDRAVRAFDKVARVFMK